MQGGSPESVQGVLFYASFDIIQITVPACQCKVCNINEYTLRQVLHGSSHCLGDAPVESNQEVQFFKSLVDFTGRFALALVKLEQMGLNGLQFEENYCLDEPAG